MRNFMMWRRTHRIELFAAAVCTVVVFLCIDLFSISLYAKNVDKDMLSSEAIYVSKFTTSLSGVEGDIANVYVNEDLTKCAILLKFKDMSNIVSDATSYQVYVKGFNVSRGDYAKETLCSPKGGYYVFGSTGYALIYLVDSNGFPNQAIECIVRCNDTIFVDSTESSSVSELKQKDGSYEQYDQYRIIINPAAEHAERVSFLDDFDVVSLYQNAVADADEADIRARLTDDVSQLNTQMKAIQNYRSQLESLRVKVPALPDFIAYDTFESDEDGQLIYIPGITLAGGVDFDWFHHDLKNSTFLTEEIIGLKKPSQFFGDLKATDREDMPIIKEFYTLEGDLIVEDTSSALSDVAAMSKNIDNYRRALQTYHNLKYQYQAVDMVSYLQLEYNMMNTGKNFSSNYNDNTIIVW